MRAVLDEQAGVHGAGHLVHVVDIAGVHTGGVGQATFEDESPFDGFVHVGGAQQRDNGHQLFHASEHVVDVALHVHDEQTAAVGHVDAGGLGDEGGVTADHFGFGLGALPPST